MYIDSRSFFKCLSHHIYNIYTAMCIICKFSQNKWINIFTHVIITSVLKFLITPKFLDILKLFSHCFKGLCFTLRQILIFFLKKIHETLSSESYHYNLISLRKTSPKRKPLGKYLFKASNEFVTRFKLRNYTCPPVPKNLLGEFI